MTEYGIVIPAYNESARLGRTLDRLLQYVTAQGLDAEIIIVNDGSRDNTAEIVNSYSQKYPRLRLLNNPGNRGKGYSVRNGMLNATADFLLFTDADLSSPIEESASVRVGCNPNCKLGASRGSGSFMGDCSTWRCGSF